MDHRIKLAFFNFPDPVVLHGGLGEVMGVASHQGVHFVHLEAVTALGAIFSQAICN